MHVCHNLVGTFQLILLKGLPPRYLSKVSSVANRNVQGTGSDVPRARNMKLDSKTASFYYSRPSEWLGGRRAVVPCAHILGGGSSINFMVGFSTAL